MKKEWPKEDSNALKRLAVVGLVCMLSWIILLEFSIYLGNQYG